MTIMGSCLTTDYQDPNTYYIKTKVGPQNESAKCSSLPNGAVDSDGGVGAESKNGSVLRGDLFMYHDAKAKRQRLLREHEKKRDRLAQIKSNEAMDEHERLSLRSQSRTTSRQTSPRLGSRKNVVHPTDTDGSGSEGASSSGRNGRQAWSPSTVDDFIPEGVEDPKEVLSEETVGRNKTVNGNDVASSAASDSNSSVLPNQRENNAEVNGNNLDQPDSNGLEDGSALSPTRRKGGKSKSKSTNSTDVVDTVVSNG